MDTESLKQWATVVSVMTWVCLCWYALFVIGMYYFGLSDGYMFLVFFRLWPLNVASSVGLVLTSYLMKKTGRQWLSDFSMALFILNAVYAIYLFFLIFYF